MSKYFGIPFARDGDKTAIPDTVQPGGEISYPEGWTADYEAEQGVDPNAKDVDRQKENQFKFDISEAMKEVQERGVLPYRADIDYPIDGVVIASDSLVYIAIAANGPATSVVDPVGNPATWKKVNLDAGDFLSSSSSDTFTGDTLTLDSSAKLRLANQTDASETSTNHAFQVGADSSNNIVMDNNEIMARDNGVQSELLLNNGASGADVKINSGVVFHENNSAAVIDSGSNANGNFRRWSDGHIEQWGALSGSAGSGKTQTFPILMPNDDYAANMIAEENTVTTRTTKILSRSTANMSFIMSGSGTVDHVWSISGS